MVKKGMLGVLWIFLAGSAPCFSMGENELAILNGQGKGSSGNYEQLIKAAAPRAGDESEAPRTQSEDQSGEGGQEAHREDAPAKNCYAYFCSDEGCATCLGSFLFIVDKLSFLGFLAV